MEEFSIKIFAPSANFQASQGRKKNRRKKLVVVEWPHSAENHLVVSVRPGGVVSGFKGR